MMRAFLSLPVAIFVVALLSSCEDITVLRYESTARPPKSLDSPIAILDKAKMTRPYKVIGLIKIDASTKHFTAEVVEQIKTEARKLGGDAVIDLQQQQLENNFPIGGFPTVPSDLTYSGHLRDLWTAKVIVWQTP